MNLQGLSEGAVIPVGVTVMVKVMTSQLKGVKEKVQPSITL